MFRTEKSGGLLVIWFNERESPLRLRRTVSSQRMGGISGEYECPQEEGNWVTPVNAVYYPKTQ